MNENWGYNAVIWKRCINPNAQTRAPAITPPHTPVKPPPLRVEIIIIINALNSVIPDGALRADPGPSTKSAEGTIMPGPWRDALRLRHAFVLGPGSPHRQMRLVGQDDGEDFVSSFSRGERWRVREKLGFATKRRMRGRTRTGVSAGIIRHHMPQLFIVSSFSRGEKVGEARMRGRTRTSVTAGSFPSLPSPVTSSVRWPRHPLPHAGEERSHAAAWLSVTRFVICYPDFDHHSALMRACRS